MTDAADAPDTQGFVQSLARGLSVIAAFGAERPRMSLSEVARESGLSRATARRFLMTLVALGYVRVDGREFALTPRVLELGYSYLSALSLPEVAQPHLEALSAEVGESSSASVLAGDEIVYVARVPVRRIMSISITIGTRFPAWATSMGRVLLAGLPEAEREAAIGRISWQAFTSRTISDPDELRRELARVAEQGHAQVDGELEAGLRSLSVPVRDRGAVVAAINVSSAVADPSQPVADGVLDALHRTSAAIQHDLELLPARSGRSVG